MKYTLQWKTHSRANWTNLMENVTHRKCYSKIKDLVLVGGFSYDEFRVITSRGTLIDRNLVTGDPF